MRARRRWVGAARVAVAVAVVAVLVGFAAPRLAGRDVAPSSARVVVGLGDSVMAGTSCDCDGITEEYADRLSLRTGQLVEPVDLGASGETTHDLLDRLEQDPDVRHGLHWADAVLVVEGANDLQPQRDAFEDGGCGVHCRRVAATAMGARLQRALEEIDRLAPHASVVVAGYWNVFEDGDVARASQPAGELAWSRSMTDDADTAISNAAKATGATYVDLRPVFGRDPTRLLADDGDHPNAAGVKRIVTALLDAARAS